MCTLSGRNTPGSCRWPASGPPQPLQAACMSQDKHTCQRSQLVCSSSPHHPAVLRETHKQMQMPRQLLPDHALSDLLPLSAAGVTPGRTSCRRLCLETLEQACMASRAPSYAPTHPTRAASLSPPVAVSSSCMFQCGQGTSWGELSCCGPHVSTPDAPFTLSELLQHTGWLLWRVPVAPAL